MIELSIVEMPTPHELGVAEADVLCDHKHSDQRSVLTPVTQGKYVAAITGALPDKTATGSTATCLPLVTHLVTSLLLAMVCVYSLLYP